MTISSQPVSRWLYPVYPTFIQVSQKTTYSSVSHHKSVKSVSPLHATRCSTEMLHAVSFLSSPATFRCRATCSPSFTQPSSHTQENVFTCQKRDKLCSNHLVCWSPHAYSLQCPRHVLQIATVCYVRYCYLYCNSLEHTNHLLDQHKLPFYRCHVVLSMKQPKAYTRPSLYPHLVIFLHSPLSLLHQQFTTNLCFGFR